MEIFDRYNRKFDALICLNSDLPTQEIYHAFKFSKLIAADGAAEFVFAQDIYPDYIIGDFDSLNRSVVPPDFEINKFIVDHNQDTNDFEKIFRFCLQNKFQKLLIFGLHGGELEHTLNNISVLKKFAQLLNITLYDKNRMAVPITNHIILPTKENEIISLIPLPRAKVKTKNLKWELQDEYLEIGSREGARNIALASNVEITVLEGELLLFFDADLNSFKQ